LKTSLTKKEKESNNLTEENAGLKESLSKLKNYNEEEVAKNKELQKKLKNLEADYKKLQQELESKNKIRSLNSVNLDFNSEVKVLDQKKNETREENQVVKKQKENSENIISKIVPPPPLAPFPPPPLPPPFGDLPSPKTAKKIPKSKVPMKCFNWNKLPLNIFDKTLWKDVNDENIFNILNLDEFQKTFSAYQKSNENDSLASTIVTSNSQYSLNNNFRSLENITKVKTTRKEFSVIDFTRGRNLTILLSKLKMTTNELKNILLNFDDEDELPRDMIEQLLKFIPTVEEETLLEDNLTELTNMAKADRFLFEVSKIYRYKQKLETLLFKKKYLERYKEIGQLIDKIIKCCQILKNSKNVMQMLEIVLAMGNFMNQSSKKGVAVGFSISNLNKLIDIKSANDRSFSLLHFLVTTIQDKVIHYFFVKIIK
jgi:dishevelled associated activator of morphogenesis